MQIRWDFKKNTNLKSVSMHTWVANILVFVARACLCIAQWLLVLCEATFIFNTLALALSVQMSQHLFKPISCYNVKVMRELNIFSQVVFFYKY